MDDYHKFKCAHEVHIEKVVTILVTQLCVYDWNTYGPNNCFNFRCGYNIDF
jgi:hypothetical protein